MSQDGNANGHGSTWLVTYCDMVTLLIACFIMIITFASKAQEKHARKRDSLLQGAGGTGAAGAAQKGPNHDAVVARSSPSAARITEQGSEFPAVYSDPSPETTAEVLRGLESTRIGTLKDCYDLRLPLGLFFDANGRLSEKGAQVLQTIGRQVRALPYDLLLQVDDPAHLAKAVALSHYLARQEAIHPGRLGVGVRAASGSRPGALWLTCARQP